MTIYYAYYVFYIQSKDLENIEDPNSYYIYEVFLLILSI